MGKINRQSLGLIILVIILFASLIGCGSKQKDDQSLTITEHSAQIRQSAPFETSPAVSFQSGSVVYYQPKVGSTSTSPAIRSGSVESTEDLRVLDWGPVNQLPSENRRPRITISFSQPMVGLAMIGEVQRSSSVMLVEPNVPGVYRWYGSRTLVFIPDNPLDGQQPFTVRLNPELRSLTGAKLHSDYLDFSFSFYRERLALVQVFPGQGGEPVNHNQLPTDQKIFTLLFNSAVDPQTLSSSISAEIGPESAPQLARFTLRHPELAETRGDDNLRRRSIVLELTSNLPENSLVRFRLHAGARAFPGFMETLQDQTWSFHTITPFLYNTFSTRSYGFPRSPEGTKNPVFLEFTHPVDASTIAGNISIDLNLAEGQHLTEFIDVHQHTIRLNNLPFVYESTYTIQLGSGIRDIYGRELGTPSEVTFRVPRASRYYYFPNSGNRFLESQFEPKLIFEHQNMDTGVWRIDSITNPFQAFSAASLYPYDFTGIPENTRWLEVINLLPFLNESGKGWVGLSWNFAEPNNQGVRPAWRQTNLQLQVTDMGVTVRYGYNQALVWVRSLTDNSPVSNARVSLLSHARTQNYGNVARTNQDGLAVISLTPGEFQLRYRDQQFRDSLVIRVENGDDTIEFIPNQSHNIWSHGIRSSVNPGRIENPRRASFLFSDRGLYRPGETITFRGIDRDLVLGNYQVYTGGYVLRLVSANWQVDTVFTQQRGRVTENGGFYGTFTLDSGIDPGLYYLEYQRDGADRWDREQVPIQIGFFRNAAFAVTLEPPALSVIAGEEAPVGIYAEYLSGGPMGSANYRYDISREPQLYRPPGIQWDQYRFGPLQQQVGRGILTQGEGQLDGSGRSIEQVRTESSGTMEGMPQLYRVEARVQDADSQEIAGRTSFLVHPAEVYAGLRIIHLTRGHWGGYFAESGKRYQLESQLVTVEGATPGRDFDRLDNVTFELVQTKWKLVQQQGVGGRMNTRYEREQIVIHSGTIGLSGGRGLTEFTMPEAGTYTLRVRGSDSSGRQVLSEVAVYATGSGIARWWGDDSGSIGMHPDRAEYQVGDTAHIFVQTPLPKGEYLLTIEREGIFSHEIISIDGTQTILEIPIEDFHVPIMYVMLSTSSERQEVPQSYFEPDLGKPKGYFGAAVLVVNPEPRRFDIEIIPAADGFQPGESAAVRLQLTKNGQPLSGAEVSFMAVDRGVLDLINYRVPDPVAFFYNPYRFPLGTTGADLRSLLIDPVTYEVKNLQGGDTAEDKLEERADFRPTAYFEPYLVSDEHGIIDLEIDLPDSLTTYRLTAVGVHGNNFAIRESEILVSNPMPMRASLPRRMRVRDTSRAGVVIRNPGAESRRVVVTLDVQPTEVGRSDGLSIDGTHMIEITIEPGQSRELAFQLAALHAGTYDLIFDLEAWSIGQGMTGAREPSFRDRLRTSLQVESSLNPETVSVFGTVTSDSDALEQFVFPTTAAQGFGELRFQFHGSRLHQLAHQIASLNSLWHSSLSSRIAQFTPSILIGTRGIDELTGSRGKTREEIIGFIQSMAQLQHADGGFVEFSDVLPRSRQSSLTTTLSAAHLLADYQVSTGQGLPATLNQQALRTRLDTLVQDDTNDLRIRAYSYYVRSRLFGSNLGTARLLLEYGDRLGMDGLGLVTLALLQPPNRSTEAVQIARTSLERMMNMVQISPQGVDFLQSYQVRSYFDAPARRLALLHMVVANLQPDSIHLDRIAHSMVREINSGQWSTREDQLWGIRALAQPLEGNIEGTSEAQVPQGENQGEISVTLGGSDLLSVHAPGIYEPGILRVFPLFEPPLSSHSRTEPQELVINSTAPHQLHYGVYMQYALPNEVLAARDEGIGVTSWIEKTDGSMVRPEDLIRGETYRMVVNLETISRYYNLALRVPVPSGAEIIDGSFQTSGQYAAAGGVNQQSWERETQYGDTERYTGEGYYGFNADGWWLEFIRPIQRIYDNELHYYFGSVYAGSQTLTFLFRAVYPGIYPLPPAFAELIDEPEVFGRGDGNLVIIQ